MSEADVFAKLSRLLQTHQLNLDGDDATASDIEDIISRIDGGGSSSSSRGRGGGGASLASGRNSTQQRGGLSSRGGPGSPSGRGGSISGLHAGPSGVEGRPTPYDVWQAKRANQFSFEGKEQAAKLTEQQWDRLVDNLHRTSKIKESATKEQNQGLAHELGGLSFKPKMNSVSLVLASTMKSLNHRLPGMMSKREEVLRRKREENAEREMAQCTFKPRRQSEKASERYLAKKGVAHSVSPEEFMRFHEEKLRRIEQRKLILDEIESRELTFKPQLNAKSLKIQEKLRANGKIEVDPVSKQTSAVARRNSSSMAGSSTASVNSASLSNADGRGRWATQSNNNAGQPSVYDRLYTQAIEQFTEHHNTQAELMQSKLAISIKPWEAPREKLGTASPSWTQNKTHLSKTPFSAEGHLLSPAQVISSSAPPVFVVEYSDDVAPVWRSLRAAVPVEGIFEDTEIVAANADL